MLNRRYSYDLGLLAAVYEQGGRDFRALLATLRAAAASPDPWAYLRRVAPSEG
jgi:hypothetical protein